MHVTIYVAWSRRYAYSVFICTVAVMRTPRIISAWSGSTRQIHSVVIGVFYIIRSLGVFSIVAILSSPWGVIIQGNKGE